MGARSEFDDVSGLGFEAQPHRVKYVLPFSVTYSRY